MKRPKVVQIMIFGPCHPAAATKAVHKDDIDLSILRRSMHYLEAQGIASRPVGD
jgi:hypothetical protein